MFPVVKSYDELFNTLIKINNEDPIMVDFNCEYNTKSNISGKIPISNKYFLSILSTESEDVSKFFSFISDGMGTEYPFKKSDGIDYSMVIEPEQFFNMDIYGSSLRELNHLVGEFLKVVMESNGEICFIIDIKFIIDFEIHTKQSKQPNHLVEMILYLLAGRIDHIVLIDSNGVIKNNSNMLYIQFESCLKNFNPNKYQLDKNILVYRKTADSVVETVY